MDIKEIALCIDSKLCNEGSVATSADYAIKFATALLAEVQKQNEPVACRYKDHNGHWCFMGKQYGNNEPLYTSDQVAAAVVKATKPLEEEITRRVTVDEMNAEIDSASKAVAEHYEEKLAKKEQRIAELEAEVERLSAAHVKACQANADSKAELAAEQLNNKRLRDALEFFFPDWKTYDHLSWKYKAKEALSTLISTEALDAYIKQKIKEYYYYVWTL